MTQNQFTDWRGLCEELVETLDGWHQAVFETGVGWVRPDETYLLDRARAALAQPEPEVVGPTFEQLYDLTCEYDGEPVASMQAALARWGRPAPAPAGEVGELVDWLRLNADECVKDGCPNSADHFTRAGDLLELQAAPVPILVSERLPGAEDCDAEGRCWWWDGEWGLVEQRFTDCLVTHWLPAHALPLPSGEVE